MLQTATRSLTDRPMGWTACVVSTPGRGLQTRHLRLVDPIVRIDRTVDRHPNSILLEDPAVSQGMVSLRAQENGRYELEDVGSRNPVRLNGAVVRRATLDANDVVRIGDSLLVIDRDDASRTANRRDRLSLQHADALLASLLMFESTAACLLRVEASLLEPDASCIAIWTPGPLESRAAAEWLSTRWDCPLAVVEALRGDAVERLAAIDDQTAVLVDRLDLADPGKILALQEAIGARNARNRAAPLFLSVDSVLRNGAPPALDQVISLLSQWELQIPRLGERRADLLKAIETLLREDGELADFHLPADFCEHALCYDWPGQLAELRRQVRRVRGLLKRGDRLTPDVLLNSARAPVNVEPDRPLPIAPTADSILAAFHEHDGNVTAIAAHFGYSRTYFYRLVRNLGIDVHAIRDRWSRERNA